MPFGYDWRAAAPQFPNLALAASKPNPALDVSGLRRSTALSAVFQRLAKEEPVPEGTSLQFEGFGDARAPARNPPPPARRDAPASRRQSLRGRVRDWLGEAPPAFETVPQAETPTAPMLHQPHRPNDLDPSAASQVKAATAPTPSPPRRSGDPIPSVVPPEHAAHQPTPRNRRLYRRVQLPAEIEIAGVPCTLIDISVGGFAATGVPPLAPDSHVSVAIRLTIDGIEVGTQLDARVVYVIPGRSSGRFVDLSPSQMAFLRYLVTWRGESIGAVGATTLLDAITGGPSGRPGRVPGDDPRFDPAPRGRSWTGWLGRKA